MFNYQIYILLFLLFLIFAYFLYYVCNKTCKDNSLDNNLVNYDFNITIENNENTNYQSINPANQLVIFESSNPEKECIICFEKMGDIECKLNCNHTYHYNCIKEWVEKKNTCPECRSLVDPDVSVI